MTGPMLALVLFAFSLAMDAFAVAVSQGSLRLRPRFHGVKVALAFGGAQAVMPLAGSLIGLAVHAWIDAFDHWVVLLLLGFLGVRMIRQAFNAETAAVALTSWALAAAAVATSVDALAAGFTLPSLGLPVMGSAAAIGLVTALLCFAGVRCGAALGHRAGPVADVLGGLILIGIGLNTFVSHQFLGG